MNFFFHLSCASTSSFLPRALERRHTPFEEVKRGGHCAQMARILRPGGGVAVVLGSRKSIDRLLELIAPFLAVRQRLDVDMEGLGLQALVLGRTELLWDEAAFNVDKERELGTKRPKIKPPIPEWKKQLMEEGSSGRAQGGVGATPVAVIPPSGKAATPVCTTPSGNKAPSYSGSALDWVELAAWCAIA